MNFQTYPFEKLQALVSDIPQTPKISLTIGEPQFPTPALICEALCKKVETLNKYPKTAGENVLKEALLQFLQTRFSLTMDFDNIIATFGTREVLFNFPQFFLFNKTNPTLAYPNPFYQIYEGAAIASRAKSIYMNLTAQNDFKPYLTKEQMKTCDLVILNSPNNPTGSTLSLEELKVWVQNALEYDFVILSDECYSEIYSHKPPASILEASWAVGNQEFKNILALNSISKRSSAPGLRSGFIAGDKAILKDYARYRTYVGCAIPLPLQYAAAVAWADEEHPKFFQEQYRENLALAQEILGVQVPCATFYVWLFVGDDLQWTRELLTKEEILVLPGSYLSRTDSKGINPGKGYVRLALVYEKEIIKDALLRIKKCL